MITLITLYLLLGSQIYAFYSERLKFPQNNVKKSDEFQVSYSKTIYDDIKSETQKRIYKTSKIMPIKYQNELYNDEKQKIRNLNVPKKNIYFNLTTQMKLSRFTSNIDIQPTLKLQGTQDSVESLIKNDQKIEALICRKKFSSKSKESTISASTSPELGLLKDSGYSTYQDDDSFQEELYQRCDEFYQCGCCIKGTGCDFLHEGKEGNDQKMSLRMKIMSNFPEMLGIALNKRTKSFLL